MPDPHPDSLDKLDIVWYNLTIDLEIVPNR